MRRTLKQLVLTGLIASVAMGGAIAQTPSVAEPAAGVVHSTTTYRELVIAEGRVPVAPPGKLLSMTVDGVERPLAPGRYAGHIVLTVTDDIPIKYRELDPHHFRAALYVEDGVPVPRKSVTAAIASGQYGPGSATDIEISSVGERFNGVLVTGEGGFTIDRPVINLTGNGGNDFAGFGAAIMSAGNADVTVNRPIIRTQGAVRTALFVGGHSTMHVNDAEIEVRNGVLPPDYKFTIDVGRMMEVPWMLGLSGNVRASNLVDNGTLYINRSHIRAQGWGALSTDDNVRVRMFVKDSLIETVESGYGAYSIGDSVDSFSHSVIRAADIGVIMAGEGSVVFTDGTIVESGRFGVMMHSGMGGGTLTIDKRSRLSAQQTAIQVKGIGTTVLVEDATLTAGNDILLQSMENDDPFMKAMMSGQMPEGMSAPPPGTGVPGGPQGKGPPPSPDVTATFRNVTLDGHMYNAREGKSGMTLAFENAVISGVLSTSVVTPASGRAPERATYQEIGHVVNVAGPTEVANGLGVSLDPTSRWTVTGPSYLTSLVVAKGATIDGGGRKLEMTVNGKKQAIRPGEYQGRIVLTPK